MDIELHPMSDQVNLAFEQWQLLVELFRKSNSMISTAMSRVDRGNRLRAAAPLQATGETAYILAQASGYETQAHTYLSVLPGYNEYFRREIIKVQDKIKGGMYHG